jgi:hypothetical protein
VATHRFTVPPPHAIPDSARPFFLPPSDEGLSFVINPEAELPNQVVVGVGSRDAVCARAAGTNAYINSTVCDPLPFSWRGIPLRKSGDETFWNYLLPATGGSAGSKQQQVLVSCYKLDAGGKRGLCTANLPFRDLVLTLHIKDSEIPNLAQYFDRATSLLRRWGN